MRPGRYSEKPLMKYLLMQHYGEIMRPYFLNEEKYGEAFPEFFESDRSLSGLSWREMTAG